MDIHKMAQSVIRILLEYKVKNIQHLKADGEILTQVYSKPTLSIQNQT